MRMMPSSAVAGRMSRAVASILYVGHATTLIELDGVQLMTDPLLRRHVGHLRRLVPLGEALPSPDAVLLSHLHTDHLHVPSLRRLGQSVPAARAPGCRWAPPAPGFPAGRRAVAGRRDDVGGLTIGAVPALHDGRRYPVGRQIAANGYTVTGSRSLYFAGDTDYFEAMSELAGADVALLPVSGWGAKVGPGHLDPVRAADALRLLRPRLAIPIHWGTYAPLHWRLSGHQPPHDDPRRIRRRGAVVAPDVRCASSGRASAPSSDVTRATRSCGSPSLADDAAEADVRRRRVHRLALPGRRPVAQAVVGGAQVRAALDHLAGEALARQGRRRAARRALSSVGAAS